MKAGVSCLWCGMCCNGKERKKINEESEESVHGEITAKKG